MPRVYYLDDYRRRVLVGLTLQETFELEALERVTPSLADWDGYSMQPVSEREKRWEFLTQKNIDAKTSNLKERSSNAFSALKANLRKET